MKTEQQIRNRISELQTLERDCNGVDIIQAGIDELRFVLGEWDGKFNEVWLNSHVYGHVYGGVSGMHRKGGR